MLGGGQYYTLVAGLRNLGAGAGAAGAAGAAGVVGAGGASEIAAQKITEIRDEILGELRPADRRAADMLLALGALADLPREDIEALYAVCAHSSNRFLREWAAFDYELRTRIADGTLPEMDIADFVARERAIDSLRWARAEELSEFDTFGSPTVLAYLVKLGIVGRWAALDPATGREMYDKLVNSMEQ